MRNIVFLCLLILGLTGCGGGRDPEDRAYIITMGIDKTENGILFSFAPAKTTESNSEVVSVEAATLAAALTEADSRSSREVYLGQLKTVIFGKSLLADASAFSGILEELERGTMISEKVMVLASSQKAEDCVKAIGKADSATGLFLWDFYKNTASEVGTTRAVDFDLLLTELREQKNSCVLPRLESNADTLTLGSGIVIADGAYLTAFSTELEQAHLLLLGEGRGAVIEGQYKNMTLPLEVRKNTVKYTFTPTQSGKVLCHVTLCVSGTLTSGGLDDLTDLAKRRALEQQFAILIETQVQDALMQMQGMTDGDILGIFAKLYRTNPTLSEQVTNWQDLQMQVECKLTLQDTGRSR